MSVRTSDLRMRIIMIGSVVLLLALALLFNTRDARSGPRPGPPLSMHASVGDGARGLALWLEELGYDVAPLEYRPWGVPDDTDVLFMLTPTRDVKVADAETVLGWVEGGGHLIVGVQQYGFGLDSNPAHELLNALGLRLADDEWISAAQPTLPLAGRALDEVSVETDSSLVDDLGGWLPILSPTDDSTSRLLGATRAFGSGQVYVVSSLWIFSNDGIHSGGNAEFVLALLGDHPATDSTRILFDEYHHGRTEHGTLTARIVREPWGWAIVYLFVVGFIWIAWSGVRFGQPLRAPRAASRRTSGEYITTLATALRQNRQQTWLQQQYAAQVKRRLARRYRIRVDHAAASAGGSAAGDQFMAQISARQPRLAALAEPLRALEQGTLSPEAATAQMQDIEQLLQDAGAAQPDTDTRNRAAPNT